MTAALALRYRRGAHGPAQMITSIEATSIVSNRLEVATNRRTNVVQERSAWPSTALPLAEIAHSSRFPYNALPHLKVEEANRSISVSEGVTSRMDLLTLYRLLLIAAALI